MNINQKLKTYIEKNIFPEYQKNDQGHDINHINYVINRSLKFAKTISNINYNMVYVIATYHDIGHHIDAKNHEKISSEILSKDDNLKEYFNDEQINIMKEAIYDHRASLKTEPRSIYGKIISSADRNTQIDSILKRTYQYRLKHSKDNNLDDIITESKEHIIKKFGPKGYANQKMYFEDSEYIEFLKEVEELTKDDKQFKDRYIKVNNIEIKQD